MVDLVVVEAMVVQVLIGQLHQRMLEEALHMEDIVEVSLVDMEYMVAAPVAV